MKFKAKLNPKFEVKPKVTETPKPKAKDKGSWRHPFDWETFEGLRTTTVHGISVLGIFSKSTCTVGHLIKVGGHWQFEEIYMDVAKSQFPAYARAARSKIKAVRRIDSKLNKVEEELDEGS